MWEVLRLLLGWAYVHAMYAMYAFVCDFVTARILLHLVTWDSNRMGRASGCISRRCAVIELMDMIDLYTASISASMLSSCLINSLQSWSQATSISKSTHPTVLNDIPKPQILSTGQTPSIRPICLVIVGVVIPIQINITSRDRHNLVHNNTQQPNNHHYSMPLIIDSLHISGFKWQE